MISYIDISGVNILKEVLQEYKAVGINVYFACCSRKMIPGCSVIYKSSKFCNFLDNSHTIRRYKGGAVYKIAKKERFNCIDIFEAPYFTTIQ
jgi:hypothetical protein